MNSVMKFFRTIRGRLFIYYSSIVILLTVLFVSLFYSYTSKTLEQQASDALLQLTINTHQAFDAKFQDMNQLANRVISSQIVKDIFYDRDTSESQMLENRWKLFQQLFALSGSVLDYQINLICTDGHFAEYGQSFDIREQNPDFIRELPWVRECLEKEGRFTLSSPRVSEWRTSGAPVISLNRAFYDVFGAEYTSIVEIQEKYRTFAQFVESNISIPSQGESAFAFVYDKSGSQIYPYTDGAADALGLKFYRQIAETGEPYGTLSDKKARTARIVAYSVSDYSGYTVIAGKSRTELLAPLRSFRNNLLLLGFLVLLVTLLITYIIASQLTVPIHNIQESINRLNLGDLSPEDAARGTNTTYELDQLNDAYASMVNRLQTSLEQTVTAKSQEIQARMLALQAQMNPHFLYNTLTTISIKAENHGDMDIVDMCDNLSSMLRYIAKEGSASVTIAVELDYLEKYLRLMKNRYPAQFTVTTEIPEELTRVQVPKLILQPIIENCFKYAFNKRAPWLIEIKGQMHDGLWSISVTDNGVGFDQEVLAFLQENMASDTFHFASDNMEKTGLLNIYYRLKLRYGEDAIFQILNLDGEGSTVTIGGKELTYEEF